MSTIKRIFISDIHMGDGRSVNPGGEFNPYCWFSDNCPDMLTKFLKQYCIDDTSVNEVVIVGDLFDEWVCPTQFDPIDPGLDAQQFENIAHAAHNQDATACLKELAAQHKLIYLRGNHDMLADSAAIGSILPGVRCIASPNGHDVYQEDGIWAEHGHWYGLFNAPYPVISGAGFSASILPLGFFVSRISAQEVLKTGKSSTSSQIFLEWIGHILAKVPVANDPSRAMDKADHDVVDGILMDLLDIEVKDHIPDQQGAVMNGFDKVPGLLTWKEIKDRYGRIFSEWKDTHMDNVGPLEAMLNETGSLDQAVSFIFLKQAKAKILIFGHTHKYDFWSTMDDSPTTGSMPSGAQRIYANAGAWIKDPPHRTFVEIESDPTTGNHTVRLREWVQQTSDGQYVAHTLLEECINGDV